MRILPDLLCRPIKDRMNKRLEPVLIARFHVIPPAPGAAFLFSYPCQYPAVVPAPLLQVIAAVSNLSGRGHTLLDYQLPHGKLWLFYLNVCVVLSQMADHLRRVNSGLVEMSVKLDA